MLGFGKKVNSISVHDLNDKIGKINLIDIRESYEYNEGHVPTAENIPMGDIINYPDDYLDKDKEYYIICQSGARSSSVCKQLYDQGYKVINVSGGTGSYLLPLER
jgi:rhodanese-related sulfurtransferase